MPKNAGDFQFCHFCYCIHFPKYAIMHSVKSKIMHSYSIVKIYTVQTGKKMTFFGIFLWQINHGKCQNQT